MATTQIEYEAASAAAPDASAMLFVLGSLAPDAVEATLQSLALAFPGQTVDVATPEGHGGAVPPSGLLRVTSYNASAGVPGNWLLTAADYVNTYKLMQERKASACILLGPEAQSLSPEALRALAEGVTGGADLVTPRYSLGPRDGLVNSAILYPVTRAIFGTRPRFPLAIDLAFSARMANRLATAAQKFTASNQSGALIWPVAEAATAGFTIAEVEVGHRTIPPPESMDLNTLLAQIGGALFADIDAKASFWQRARLAYSPKAAAAQADVAMAPTADGEETPDVQPMLDSFRLAYTNLHEIWSLVLPPNSLLGLKKLSAMPPAAFRMPDALWARIVYDFILAYRLRTLNRGHLLGALTPLYLAWVASHLLLTSGVGTDGMASEKHIEMLAAAFETDKAYLVSRWRWPDRFNP